MSIPYDDLKTAMGVLEWAKLRPWSLPPGARGQMVGCGDSPMGLTVATYIAECVRLRQCFDSIAGFGNVKTIGVIGIAAMRAAIQGPLKEKT